MHNVTQAGSLTAAEALLKQSPTVEFDSTLAHTLKCHQFAIEMMAKANMDFGGALFFAHALVEQAIGTAFQRYGSHQRAWVHEHANSTKKTHDTTWQHYYNIAGGIVSMAAGYFADAANKERVQAVSLGSQMGASALSGWSQSYADSTRTESQSLQNVLNSAQQHTVQEAGKHKEMAQQGIEKAAQLNQAKAGAFSAMARG